MDYELQYFSELFAFWDMISNWLIWLFLWPDEVTFKTSSLISFFTPQKKPPDANLASFWKTPPVPSVRSLPHCRNTSLCFFFAQAAVAAAATVSCRLGTVWESVQSMNLQAVMVRVTQSKLFTHSHVISHSENTLTWICIYFITHAATTVCEFSYVW